MHEALERRLLSPDQAFCDAVLPAPSSEVFGQLGMAQRLREGLPVDMDAFSRLLEGMSKILLVRDPEAQHRGGALDRLQPEGELQLELLQRVVVEGIDPLEGRDEVRNDLPLDPSRPELVLATQDGLEAGAGKAAPRRQERGQAGGREVPEGDDAIDPGRRIERLLRLAKQTIE